MNEKALSLIEAGSHRKGFEILKQMEVATVRAHEEAESESDRREYLILLALTLNNLATYCKKYSIVI